MARPCAVDFTRLRNVDSCLYIRKRVVNWPYSHRKSSISLVKPTKAVRGLFLLSNIQKGKLPFREKSLHWRTHVSIGPRGGLSLIILCNNCCF